MTDSGTVKKQHIYFFDALRVSAFFLIILYHFMTDVELRGIYTFTGRGIIPHSANMHFLTIGVPVFFIISGAGLMYGYRDSFSLKRYYAGRFLRICIPFYIVYLIYFVLMCAVRHGLPFSGEIPLWRILFTLFASDEYVNALGLPTFSLGIGEWFLGCLIPMYLLFPLLRWLLLKAPRLVMGISTAIYLLLAFFYPFQHTTDIIFPLKLYEFMLGMFLIGYFGQVKKSVLIITLPVLALFLFSPLPLPIPSALKTSLPALCIFLTGMQLEPLLARSRTFQKGIKQISGFSYEIYLVHHCVIYRIGELVPWRSTNTVHMLILFGAELLLIVLLAVAVKKICRLLYRLFPSV